MKSHNNINRIKNKNTLIKKLDDNPELKELYYLYIEQFQCEEEAKYCIRMNDDFSNHLCPVCNKPCAFHHINGYHEHYKRTCDNQECLNKVIHTKEAQIKRENTNLKKYGCKSSAQNEEVKKKAEKTNLERYGHKSSAQNKEIKEKSKQTSLKRYGTENPMQNEDIKEKIRKTQMSKYVFNDPILDIEIIKIIKIIQQDFHDKIINLADIYSNNECFIKFIKLIYCHKNRQLRLKEIAKIFNVVSQTIKNRVIELELDKYFYIYDSLLEIKFNDFLCANNFIQCLSNDNMLSNFYLRHDRGTLLNKDTMHHSELDFHFKNNNIAFEINDIGGHNSLKRKNKFYHYNKMIECARKNIRLIHLWEWELTNPKIWNQISLWILNLLNNNKTIIDINQCNAKFIDHNETEEFLNKYNIYGYSEASYCCGLYYQNELIQVMLFNQLLNNDYELLRFSIKYDYLLKDNEDYLLKWFIKNNNVNTIITYCNLDKFTGKTFENIGFNLLLQNDPFKLFYDNDSQTVLQESITTKIEDNKKSIYNCGQNIYIFKNLDF